MDDAVCTHLASASILSLSSFAAASTAALNAASAAALSSIALMPSVNTWGGNVLMQADTLRQMYQR
jgi:hypothetical protein